MVDVQVYPDAQTLAHIAVRRFVRLAERAITTKGRFIVALSGGKTPRAMYSLLGSDEFASMIDWTNVYVFWGDERTVPPEHPDSNYHMAKQTLLDFVPIPMDHIYRIQGEDEPVAAAEHYEARLRAFFEGRWEGTTVRPRFDLILLGIGEDGHTASMFPYTPALEETERWVIAQYVEKLQTWRVTFTPTAINSAAYILMVISGESKAAALREVLYGDYSPHEYPAQLVAPNDGTLTWLVDSAAATLLSPASTPEDGENASEGE